MLSGLKKLPKTGLPPDDGGLISWKEENQNDNNHHALLVRLMILIVIMLVTIDNRNKHEIAIIKIIIQSEYVR